MNKTILIAGVCGKIGEVTAKLFKERGWNVVGVDIKDTENSIADSFFVADVKDEAAVLKAVETIEEKFDIDAVFDAAGYELDKDFEEVRPEEWNDLLKTILGGAGNLCKAVAPKMAERKNGKIILLSCDYSKQEKSKTVNAVASHTLHGFGKSFGVEMAPRNVLVNVLYANTPLDAKKVSETVFYLADKDTYAAAQVVSVSGLEEGEAGK